MLPATHQTSSAVVGSWTASPHAAQTIATIRSTADGQEFELSEKECRAVETCGDAFLDRLGKLLDGK
jgi:hypothetical protein